MNEFAMPPPDLDFSTAKPPAMEFAFRIRIFFKERVRLAPATPMGGRVYVPPAAGDIVGPRLQGRVVPYSGADYARGRADGVGELNAHYMLEASDGTPIYINNRGFLYARDANGKPLAQAGTEPSRFGAEPPPAARFAGPTNLYFVCIPAFDAPTGPHDWLTRHVFLCRGVRKSPPDHTVFDYFVVTG
jgi:hypothetical protein